MKHLFTLIMCAAFGLASAQAPLPYINTTWTPQNIDAIKTSIGEEIGGGYSFSSQQIVDNAGVAYIKYESTGDRQITVTIKKGQSGGDAEMGVKPTAVVRAVSVEGLFADLYPVYAKLLHPATTMDEVKAAGHATVPNVKVGNSTYNAYISREGSKAGYWTLTLRMI